MTKLLLVNADKCAGCMTCEMVCSAKHENVINPFQSRIKIIKWERDGEGFPTVCAQCEEAPCKMVCPMQAVTRDEELGRVSIDYDTCIGCRMCVAVCPFGAMSFDVLAKRIIKCDLCDGSPLCADFCEVGAIQYVDASQQSTIKQVTAADKLSEIMQKVAQAISTV